MIKACLILLLVNLKLSLQCGNGPSTFDNTLVEVNGKSETISGCISPDTLKFKGVISNISCSNQNVLDLNEGALQNILSKFEVTLSGNNIELIREGAFINLPELYLIDLHNNKLSLIVEGSFKDLPSLNKLGLHTNQIKEVLPRAFNNLPKLSSVVLSENKLENFDQIWFYRTPALTAIDLSSNSLRDIKQRAFFNLPSIKDLAFANNQIEFIDKDAFQGLRNMRWLNLDRNRLKTLKINIHPPSKIEMLNIEFNNMTYISNGMLEALRPKLRLIAISGNPWQCPCYERISEWAFKSSGRFILDLAPPDAAEVVCVYAKTPNFDLCVERSDDEFQEGFSKHFEGKKAKLRWRIN
ncbi:hypothetical protein PPYR_13475 [Photinus pyralis]|uniref:LRRCT domain-containing protein n=1 Tax=Photinus pyralis TaxID=7054 RepID=A0A1Y1NLA8_PHOPY|nr:reticulon-4 receptor-like [Photinus pyralis]KAB0793855.1 hypothetical protein PPYR_13475 [Photinus pyralis]